MSMKKRKRRTKKHDEIRDLSGIILVGLAFVVFLSLLTFSSDDPPAAATGAEAKNFLGILGAYISYYMLLLFGDFAYFIPVLAGARGVNVYLPPNTKFNPVKLLYIGLGAFSLCTILQINGIFIGNDYGWRGAVLLWVADRVKLLVGSAGLYITLSVFILLSLSVFIKIDKKRLAAFFRARGDRRKRQAVPEPRLPEIKKRPHRREKTREYDAKRVENLQYDIKYFATGDGTSYDPGDESGDDPELILRPDMVIGETRVNDDNPIPPSGILKYIEKSSAREDIETVSESLEDALAEFNIIGNVINVQVGPMASLYEVEVKKGTKVSKIVALDKDLSLMLKKTNIRIIAPLPGRGTVGFEIPNRHRTFVSLRELVECDEFSRSPSPLTIGFGRGMDGSPVIINIEELPHLLISGATMSGKSIGIHTIIMSVLYKASYEDVRLILIDPKRLEFPYYNGIPHLLADVIVESKEAVAVLKWAQYEMDRRYKLLAHHGFRDIQSFNEKRSDEKLPYLLIVIDELADLIVTAGQEVEYSIIRLAQMARAVGLHLILATQRPSADVITGTIKANFPSRVAYKTASKLNSRIILDEQGSETLLGKGDFLYLKITGEIERGQGALVTVPEIRNTVQYLKNIDIKKDSFRQLFEKDREISLEMDNKDELYPEVLQILYNKLLTQDYSVSTSALQRKLSIGYNRAAKIIDSLADDGLIDTEGGSKGRNILVDIEKLKDYI